MGFVCPTEIIAFSDRVAEFEALNCAVIACSTDSHFSHLAWCEKSRKAGGLGDMKIPLLADKSMATSRAYGVLKEDEGLSFRGLSSSTPNKPSDRSPSTSSQSDVTWTKPSDWSKHFNSLMNM